MPERHEAREGDCEFCAIAAGNLAPKRVAYQDADTVVFPSLHQRPQNRGHTLVASVAHVPFIYDVDRGLGGALIETAVAVAKAVKKLARADGVSLRQNNETAGGQDVFHVHFHVIPRFDNDGFHSGDDRFPFGLVEVSDDELVEQAAKLRGELRR